VQRSGGRAQSAGMVAGGSATQKRKGRVVTRRIELSANHPDLTGQVTEGRMIGLSTTGLSTTCPKRPKFGAGFLERPISGPVKQVQIPEW